MEVCTIVAGVAAAYVMGNLVGNPLLEDSIIETEINWLTAAELILLSFFSSAGFGIVFNIQIKELVFAAIGGTIVRIFICFSK